MFIEGSGYIFEMEAHRVSAGHSNKAIVGSSCSLFHCLFYCDVVKLHLVDKPFCNCKQIHVPVTPVQIHTHVA